MKNILFTISVFIPIFLNNCLGTFLGIKQLLTITMLPLFIFSLFNIITKSNASKKNINNNVTKSIAILFYIASSVLLLKISTGQYEYIRDIIYMAYLPGCIILACENLTNAQYKILRVVVIMFFLFESGTVIAEWLTMQNFFFIKNEYYTQPEASMGRWAFRGQGVFVHPILSSMVISVMIQFILSSTIKINAKYIFLLIGLMAMLAINTRTGIVLTVIMLLPTLFNNYKNIIRRKRRRMISLAVVLLLGMFIYLILNTDLGGRLFNEGLIDKSSRQRLVALSFLDVVSSEWLLYGRMDFIDAMLATNVGWVENGYIAFILKYGLIAGVPLLLSLIWVHICQLKRFTMVGSICIFLTYYLFAATNPHLASQAIWMYFLFSYYAFFPHRQTKLS